MADESQSGAAVDTGPVAADVIDLYRHAERAHQSARRGGCQAADYAEVTAMYAAATAAASIVSMRAALNPPTYYLTK